MLLHLSLSLEERELIFICMHMYSQVITVMCTDNVTAHCCMHSTPHRWWWLLVCDKDRSQMSCSSYFNMNGAKSLTFCAAVP